MGTQPPDDDYLPDYVVQRMEEQEQEEAVQDAMQEAAHVQWVADAVNQRLEDLGWNQQDLVRKSGVSATTIRWVQNGEVRTYRSGTLSKIAKALGWPAGSLAKMLSGQGNVPEPTHDPSLDDDKPIGIPPGTQPAALSGKIDRLTAAQRAKIEALVDEMLPNES